MKSTLNKIKVYAATTAGIVVGLYLLLIVVYNWAEPARVWYWPGVAAREVSVLRIATVGFIAGASAALIALAIVRALIRYRRSRRERITRRLDSEIADMTRKASMLRVRPIERSEPKGGGTDQISQTNQTNQMSSAGQKSSMSPATQTSQKTHTSPTTQTARVDATPSDRKATTDGLRPEVAKEPRTQ
jgi:hypothetical protein